jgi:pilus assembly protein CpaE
MSDTVRIPDAVSAGALSIAVVSPDEQRRKAAVTALGECNSGPIREFVAYPSDLYDVPRVLGNSFDVILVDLDSDPEYALKLIETVSSNGLAIAIAFSSQTDPRLLLRCMRAGAREFLTLPLERSDIANALHRVSALRPSTHAGKTTVDGKLLVFLGAKGGCGVTTLACSVAVSLAKDHKQRTLLIDLNLPLGDVAINLGIRPESSIVNAFQNAGRLDSHLLATMLTRHDSGLSVLAAPSELGLTYVSVDAIDKLLKVAREDFDFVVVDAGSVLDLQRKHLFDSSTTIYLVTQAGIPELRNSHRLISQLSGTGGPRLEIVLNRYDARSQEIDEEHITKALTRAPDWKIPNNYAAVRHMQNTATPLTEGSSPISRAIRQMTQSICGQATVQEEKKKKFSLFG